MDNEEIKKVLQELKESSDESSSVRSKVVKIHIDTPAEAQRRRRQKEREQARQERKLAEEAQKARALEEEKRLQAEKAALEAVEEAKREAKAGFAPDLEEAILSERESLSVNEAEEAAEDLDLSWEYEKPALKSAFAREGDAPASEGEGRSSGPVSGRAGRTAVPAGTKDDEADFASDEEDFRSEEGTSGREREIITGLPGLFGSLTDKTLSFFGGIRRSVKEDLSKARGNGEPEEEKEDAVPASEKTGKTGSDKAPGSPAPAGSAYDAKEMKEILPDDPTANLPEDAPGFDPEPGFGIRQDAQGPGGEGNDEGFGPADAEHVLTDGEDADGEAMVSSDAGKKNPSGEDTPEKEAAPRKREYGPDEEWKRRLEEVPEKKSRLSRFRRLKTELALRSKKEKPEKVKPEKEKPEKKSKKEKPKRTRQETEKPVSVSLEGADFLPEKEDAPAPQEAASSRGIAASEDTAAFRSTAASRDNAAFQDTAVSGDITALQATAVSRDIAASRDAAVDTGDAGEEMLRSIEVIDLNENQNNKEAEVIPLVGSTGPLPDPAELKKEAEKKSRPKKKTRTRRPRPDRPKMGVSVTGFFAAHRRQLLIAAAAIVLAAAAAGAVFLVMSRLRSARHASIEADEGLTVRILEQPEAYTDKGDVKIRLKAPETIQSITVNGENVVIEQGRTVEFTYHASGGTLDIMAVSTDQVRNAKVILAYVDSQPPVVTIREEDGRIALSAEDTESGVDAIYIGRMNGLSQVPQYEAYAETLEMDPEQEISYYAVDHAGNKTTPVVVALTPAQSIAFERERYGLFPGAEEKVNLVTTPEHAFVNNLVLEAENPKVVQVEGDMVLRGMAEGDTKITATADGISGVEASVSVSSQRKVRISAIGDCTLGTDETFSQNNSFDAYQAMYGNGYFFEKVKGILSADDSTFANFEGTLTTSTQREQKQFAFKGDPSYTEILQNGSIDVVSLANNHSRDYGQVSFTDTTQALESAGIQWCEGDHIAYRDLNGVLTAYIGIYSLENGVEKLPQVRSTIAEAKEKGADLIIVEFHWGAELVEEIDQYQKELAHTAVDEGANLVLGSHAHVLQGIEKYNGAYIVYGLGNFCFGGSSNPRSYDTMIWQQTFTFTANGLESEDDIAIIPCQVSSDLSSNNYQPVPVSGEAAQAIMQKIDTLSAPFSQTYSQYMVDGTLWTDPGT